MKAMQVQIYLLESKLDASNKPASKSPNKSNVNNNALNGFRWHTTVFEDTDSEWDPSVSVQTVKISN